MTFLSTTTEQINQLENQGCSAENWDNVLFKNLDSHSIPYIKNVNFSGKVKIGELKKTPKKSVHSHNKIGIYNSAIHNCELGDNIYVSKVHKLSNYIIGNNVSIENVNNISVEKETSFGNGVSVNVINESGKREIPIYDMLSSHLAYILAVYRHRTKVLAEIKKMIDAYIARVRSTFGRIGNDVKISHSNQLIDVKIGNNAVIDGVLKLKNGSINSTATSPVLVGTGVIAENFIICSDSVVNNSTLIKNCFVGQACVLDKNYSAVHSAFFANSQGYHGEACSIFAGPYTVTHHKSTLLIAGIFSFMNAGSGSNQSNHMYKLGPIHQGVVERGAKTTSDSYLLWPAKVGAFNLVRGRHYQHPDSTEFPFSYLIEGDDHDCILVPAINLRSIGTIRDAKKFPRRDERKDEIKLDCINFNLLSPYTIQKMINGRNILKNLLDVSGEMTESFSYSGMKINKRGLKRGIQLYDKAIQKFLGNSLISRLNGLDDYSQEAIRQKLRTTAKYGFGKWVDVSGLICPFQSLLDLMDDIETNKITSLTQIEQRFSDLHQNYYDYEWTWAAAAIEDFYHINLQKCTKKDVIRMVEIWQKSVIELDKLLYEDAKKEFSLSTSIGFGMDGDEKEKALDFLNVRGEFDSNDTVQEIRDHILKKEKLGNRVITQLKSS